MLGARPLAVAPLSTVEAQQGAVDAIAQTLPAATQAMEARIVFAGDAMQVLPAVQQSAAGGAVEGAVSQVLPALTQVASGSLVFSAGASQTLPVIEQQAISGTFEGSAQSGLSAIDQQAAGFLNTTGEAAQTLPAFTQSAMGAHDSLTPGFFGVLYKRRRRH